MKQLLRAAGIGFGGTLGAGAAVLVAGALVAIATRSAVRKTADDIAARVSELIDQAVAKLADEPCGQTLPDGKGFCARRPDHDGPHLPGDSTRPDLAEPSHVHTTTCPCPAWLKYPPEDPAAGVDHTMHSHPATPEADDACVARATA